MGQDPAGTGTTTVLPEEFSGHGGGPAGLGGTRAALVLAWSRDEPHRVGEVILLPGGPEPPPLLLGRGAGRPDDRAVRVTFVRQRPGRVTETAPLGGSGISRQQLLVRPIRGGGVHVENLGRCPLLFRGQEVDEAQVAPGESFGLKGQLHLLCIRRPARLPRGRSWPHRLNPTFGAADDHGVVGESPAAWDLRDQLAFIAARKPHVLILGESGTGKELAAAAVHALSDRARRPLIARNASTIPEGLIDAELFGNIKDYPNPGMRDRPGLIGSADGSTLFLDEIGELPDKLQGHLLRVLDTDGDYQRLGEDRNRKADFRLIAATNRPAESLKHDLLARLKMRVQLTGLGDRPEDIPLIARHLMQRIAMDDDDIAGRFFDSHEGSPGPGEPRFTQILIEALLAHRWTHHVRELDAVLWAAIASSDGTRVGLTSEATAELDRQRTAPGGAPPVKPGELTAESIRACLDKHDWVQERVWKELGLKNRWVLNRLIKKHGLKVSTTEES